MNPEQENSETQLDESTAETETPETSSPQSDDVAVQTAETEEGFQEVDFSELTNFADSNEKDSDDLAVATEKEGEETPEQQALAEDDDSVEEETESESETPVVEAKTKTDEKVEEPKKEAEAPAEPEVKVPTKEELQGMYKEHREKTLPILESQFQLTEEEAAALDEQPSKMLPKLAGQLMYDTMMSTYNAVLTAVPSVVNKLIDASQKATSAEKAFYDAWPDLTKPEAAPVVASAISAYRSANPRANLDDVIKNAGVMACIQLGLDPMKKTKQEDTRPPATRKMPPKPAAPRGSVQTQAPRKGNEETNEFAELTEAFLRDN